MYSLVTHLAVVGLSLAAVLRMVPEEHPTGCRDSNSTADLLRLLGAKDWAAWSREKLTDSWPGFLHLHECEPKDDECGQFATCHCDRLISQDRVIKGDCECCDLFFFDLVMEDGRVMQERLDIAILHHSVSTKGQAVAEAQEFLRAIGFHAGATGHEKFGELQFVEGHYQWPTEIRGVVNSVEVSLREVSEGWAVYVYWTRPEIPEQ